MMSGAQKASGWRIPILAQFSPEIAAVARLTIVADPDELLTEPGVIEGIRNQGFEIIPFDDHVAFRYAYERRFRQIWDTGATTNLVVVLRASRSDLIGLPFDLLEQAKRDRRLLSFSLAELFSSLAPHVLAELDRADLDAVHAAQELYQQGDLGENASRDFLLRNVFRVEPAQIRDEVELLRVLLRHHYSAKLLPASLADRFVRLLRVSPRFKDWPLEAIVPSRVKFFEFLQERWPIFLERRFPSEPRGLREESEAYDLRQTGPTDLPFEHEDVRIYMDNLFTDGLLAPTSGVSRSAVQGTWMAVGPMEDQTERLRKLLKLHEAQEPDSGSDHREWIHAALRWAEIVAVRWAISDVLEAIDIGRFESAHDRIQERFRSWLSSHYASLHSLSFLPRPVMLHQVPRYLAHRAIAAGGDIKLAVLVIDGLAMDQWVVLRQQLRDDRDWVADESGLFAWIPTLTSVSRQSIFAGDLPFFFATSLDTTRKEEQHWKRFWEDRGLRQDAVAYVCQGMQESDQSFLARVEERMEGPRCSFLGIVVGTIDRMLHGVVTGTVGLHASVRHWGQRGALRDLIEILLAGGFEVVLTADHGNVEGIGMGRPNVGVTAEERGERVHVFRDGNLRARISADYPGSIEWPTIGVPEDYLALIAPARRAFITEGRQTVAHGGICLEEVIVPFVSITRP
jgi:hypothetical protein